MRRPGRGGRALAAALLAAGLCSAVGAGGAFAAAQTIQGSDDFYLAAAYTMDQGEQPQFQNLGAKQHNVTARVNGPDGASLFSSPTIGAGVATVQGTQYLTAGTYAFYCTIHPLSMQANLQVTSAGTALARPRIDVIPGAGKLGKIVSKGKLPVTVKAMTESRGIELEVKLGKAVLGTQRAFDLAAGRKRKLSVKLSRSGKRTLAKRDSAALKVTGEVPFGAPDTGKRTYK